LSRPPSYEAAGLHASFIASRHELADGREHFIKVAYLPRVAMEYFANFSATTNAAKYAVDAGEQRRVGTFLVFIDDGIAADRPSIAFPINLPE
jgi:hypothetical protein